MKKMITFLFLACLSIATVLADEIIIEKSSYKVDSKNSPALSVNTIISSKSLEGKWKKYLSKKYKVKMASGALESDKKLMAALGVNVNLISDKKIDFITAIKTTDKGSQMVVLARFGYDIYIDATNYPREYNQIKTIVHEFLSQEYVSHYNKQVALSLKAVSAAKKYQSKLKGDNVSLAASIKGKEKKIEALNKQKEEEQQEIEANDKLMAKQDEEIAKNDAILQRNQKKLDAVKQAQGGQMP